jgi:hypothetical protein
VQQRLVRPYDEHDEWNDLGFGCGLVDEREKPYSVCRVKSDGGKLR